MAADQELAAALEPALGAPVRLLRREPSPYASSHPLERLVVAAEGAAPIDVVFKDAHPSALLPDGQLARRCGGADTAIEIEAYGLLDGAGLGTPVVVAVVRDRAWLFLEPVNGSRLTHVGDDGTWREVARWLARAHGTLVERSGNVTWLPRWAPPNLSARLGDPRVRRLAPAVAAAASTVAAECSTVIHGDLFPDNVLVGAEGRICVVDWERMARGPALLDLASLTAGRWDEPGDPLAEAYRQALPQPPERDAFYADLTACRLLVAAQHLLAPPEWSPPTEHARNWLGDAERLMGTTAAR